MATGLPKATIDKKGATPMQINFDEYNLKTARDLRYDDIPHDIIITRPSLKGYFPSLNELRTSPLDSELAWKNWNNMQLRISSEQERKFCLIRRQIHILRAVFVETGRTEDEISAEIDGIHFTLDRKNNKFSYFKPEIEEKPTDEHIKPIYERGSANAAFPFIVPPWGDSAILSFFDSILGEIIAEYNGYDKKELILNP